MIVLCEDLFFLYIKLKIFSGKVINKNLPVDKVVDKIKRKKGNKKTSKYS